MEQALAEICNTNTLVLFCISAVAGILFATHIPDEPDGLWALIVLNIFLSQSRSVVLHPGVMSLLVVHLYPAAAPLPRLALGFIMGGSVTSMSLLRPISQPGGYGGQGPTMSGVSKL